MAPIFITLCMAMLVAHVSARCLGIVEIEMSKKQNALDFFATARAESTFSDMDIVVETVADDITITTIDGAVWPEGYAIIVINFSDKALADGFFDSVKTGPGFPDSNVILVNGAVDIGPGFGELAVSDFIVNDAVTFATFQSAAQTALAAQGGILIVSTSDWEYLHRSVSTDREARDGSTIVVSAMPASDNYAAALAAVDTPEPMTRGADINTYAFPRTGAA